MVNKGVPMSKKELVVVVSHSQDASLTLEHVCEICSVSPDFVRELVDYVIVQPTGTSPQTWRFELSDLRRIRSAKRLQRDLGINIAGIAVLIEQLDEIKRLRQHLAILEKHFFRF